MLLASSIGSYIAQPGILEQQMCIGWTEATDNPHRIESAWENTESWAFNSICFAYLNLEIPVPCLWACYVNQQVEAKIALMFERKPLEFLEVFKIVAVQYSFQSFVFLYKNWIICFLFCLQTKFVVVFYLDLKHMHLQSFAYISI